MKDHDLLTAHFTDNERTNICSLWVSNETSEIHEMHIECKDGDHHFEDLITHISLDDIHENTYKFMQQQSEELQNTVIDIAKKKWLDIRSRRLRVLKSIRLLLKPSSLMILILMKHKEQLFFLKDGII